MAMLRNYFQPLAEVEDKTPAPSPPTSIASGTAAGARGGGKAMPRMRIKAAKGKRSRKKGGPRRLGSQLDDAYDIASKAYSTAMRLATYFNVEQKLFDVGRTADTISNAGLVLYYSDIAQGVAYNQRTGNSVKVVKHHFAARFRVNNSASATTVRLLLVRGRETETANPAIADVLEVSGSNQQLISPYEHSRPDRWTILFDRTFPLVIGSDSASTTFEMNLSAAHSLYQNGTGGIANAAEGQIFLLAVSDEATNTPTMDSYSRLVFVDN